MIYRKTYLDKVLPYIGKNLIKVIVGQRRVGKSFLLKMIINFIEKNHSEVNIIFIDKELYDFDFITDYHELISFVESKTEHKKANLLFIDEVQEIKQFEKALRHFLNKNIADIYCTGSNANLLSGDLATLLSGRYVEIKVNTLSYTEFLQFHDLENTNKSLQKFLKWGGLPFIRNLTKDDKVIFDYLSNIISSIIYKDILYRYKIRNVDFFDNLLKYVAANTGNLITAKKISDYLKSQKIDISTKVVLSYLYYLQNAFLVYKIKRVDIAGKKIFATNNKYFFEDWGLRNALVGFNRFSVPDILENVVFSHLKNIGYSISVGILKNLEIDFIAEKDGDILYVQVAYLIANEKVKNREFGNLLLIKDNYPKLVVSLDEFQIGSYKGITHIHLKEFLSKKEFTN